MQKKKKRERCKKRIKRKKMQKKKQRKMRTKKKIKEKVEKEKRERKQRKKKKNEMKIKQKETEKKRNKIQFSWTKREERKRGRQRTARRNTACVEAALSPREGWASQPPRAPPDSKDAAGKIYFKWMETRGQLRMDETADELYGGSRQLRVQIELCSSGDKKLVFPSTASLSLSFTRFFPYILFPCVNKSPRIPRLYHPCSVQRCTIITSVNNMLLSLLLMQQSE